MTGSHSHHDNHCRSRGSSFSEQLDHSIRCSFHRCNRPWSSIRIASLGSKRAQITAYHPQANGIVEGFHRQLKAALKAQPNPMSWIHALPLALLDIRTEDISSTTAELLYGTTSVFPVNFSPPLPLLRCLTPDIMSHNSGHTCKAYSPYHLDPLKRTVT